ncbi:MAG: hypothetical protein ACI9R3_000894 [Verrucomicrobiales bacterium]|jgi:hypothetical protein
MKLRQILATTALNAVAVIAAHGSPHTITWSAQNPGAGLGDNTGDELAPGALARLGYFGISPDEVAASFHDVGFLDSQFTEVGREQIGNFGGVVYGAVVETRGSGFGAAGAFAQTITLESDDLPADARFYVWVSNMDEPYSATAQAIFSSDNWALTSEQVTALQWGIEGVHSANTADVYLADQGNETSSTVGGTLNKLREIVTVPDGPGDLEDPDGNGIVVLLEEAFLVDGSAAAAHFYLPRMEAADVLAYNRKSGGDSMGWDLYRADDLEYRVEASTDFQQWHRASEMMDEAGVSAKARTGGGERVSLTLPVAVGRSSGTYFRVHVRRLIAGEGQ